eukprot:TRINITY_DN5486_c0_g1_i1.p1 TRINITY_DN5486_c0_g1~~TRINITY_DN5486_c0_g1_i1.p1  ORF type:complete len:518 (+),score=38.37 TRINITY_DN5486_c0_g1_i1:202-1755(+)
MLLRRYLTQGAVGISPVRPWLSKVPLKHWDDVDNVKAYLEWLRDELDIRTIDGWYSVKTQDFINNKGRGLLTKYSGSVSKLLTTVYPEANWQMWRFYKTPSHFWASQENRKSFLQWVGDKLGYGPSDWHRLTKEDLIAHGGVQLLRLYGNSPSRVIQSVLSIEEQENCFPWQFKRRKGCTEYWSEPENCRLYFEWLSKKIGVKHPEGWYSIKHVDLIQNHGSTLLRKYGDSLQNALKHTYPEVKWLPWKFSTAPPGFWENLENRKAYFSWLYNTLSLSNLQDWYNVSVQTIHENGGGGLLNRYYGGCLYQALCDVYSDIWWQPWKFAKVPAGTYRNVDTTKEYLDFLAKELQIKRFEDWYRIDNESARKCGGVSLLKKNGGLAELLPLYFPYFRWDPKQFIYKAKKSSQRNLRLSLSEIFPGNQILEDFLHPQLRFSSQMKMEIDLWLPERQKAFEYQGEQHFKDLPVLGDLSSYQMRDSEKQEKCANSGIELTIIPYWWDGKVESTRALIQEQSNS